MLWVFLACDALMIIAFAITPFVTRKTELFGVSLPSAEIGRQELSKMRKSYLCIILILGVVLIALNILLFQLFTAEMTQVSIYLILLFAFIGVSFLVYLAFHRKMKAFKAMQSWREYGATGKTGTDAESILVVDTSPPGNEVINPAWLILFPAIAGFTILFLAILWPSLPNSIPVHMDGAGLINGWMDKNAGAFVTMLVAQWILIIVFVLVYFMIRVSKRQIDAAKPAESREQGRRFRYIMSACIVFGGAAMSVIIGILPIMLAQSKGGVVYAVVPLIFIFAIIAVMLIVMFRTGQGGSRLKITDAQDTGNDLVSNMDNDKYWKLGVFYFNPHDQSFLVEKRFGIGWTLNFGHPAGWLIIIGIIVMVIVSMFIAKNA